MFKKSKLALAVLALLFSNLALGQDSGDDQVDVWAVVEAQWEADEKGEKRWIERMLSDDFVGWEKTSPSPRNKSSVEMWDRFGDQQGKTIAHELYPLAIVVHDNVAIAHYLYTSAYEDKEGDVELNNGRYSDVLIRTDDGWKFLAWHGGDDAKND